MNHINKAGNKTDIIIECSKQTPGNSEVLLGLPANYSRLDVYKNYKELINEIQRENLSSKQEALEIIKVAKDAILMKLYLKQKNSKLANFLFFLALIFLILAWSYMIIPLIPSTPAMTILLSLILGYFGMDLWTALVHLSLDHFVPFTAPVFGELAQDFEWHHERPDDITKKTFLENAKPIITFALPPFAVLGLLLMSHPLAVFSLFFGTLFGLISQSTHQWAHMKTPPNRFIKWLQDHHLILSSVQHRVHHNTGSQEDFCIFAGHVNSLVNKLKKILDRFITIEKF